MSDYLAHEIQLLDDLVASRKLDLSNVVTRSVPLTAQAINDTLDSLENFGDDVRVVVEP